MFGKVQRKFEPASTPKNAPPSTGEYDNGGVHVVRVEGNTTVDLARLKGSTPLTLYFTNKGSQPANLKIVHSAGLTLSGFICDFMSASILPIVDKDFLALHDVGATSFHPCYKVVVTVLPDRVYAEAYGDWL